MSSISVALAVSRAVELKYPLEAVLESVAPVARTIVVNIDSTYDDGTLMLVDDIYDRFLEKFPKFDRSDHHLVYTTQKWDWSNRHGGSEIAIQSNEAVRVASEYDSEWIFHCQCDEMLHEDDHDLIRWLAVRLPDDYAGVEFERLYFWRDLHTLRTDWTQPLVRMFRRGRGRVAGDGMNCEVDGKVWPVDRDGRPTPALFHYSRVLLPGGDGAAIAKRIQALDSLFHDPETIGKEADYRFELREFDSYAAGTDPKPVSPEVLIPWHGNHPEPARRLRFGLGLDTGQIRE